MWLWAYAMQPQWIQVQNGNFERHFQETKVNQRHPEIAKSMKMETAISMPRLSGNRLSTLNEKADVKGPEDERKHPLTGVSSDERFCGAISFLIG